MSDITDKIIGKRIEQLAFLNKACDGAQAAYALLCDRIIALYDYLNDNPVIEIPSGYDKPFTVSEKFTKISSPFPNSSDFSYVSLKDPSDGKLLIVDTSLLIELLRTHHIEVYFEKEDLIKAGILPQYMENFKEEYLGSNK